MYKKFVLFIGLFSLCVASDQPLILPCNSDAALLFTRGPGFWTDPADESRLDYFGKLTESKSQREDWYKVTPYIAEFGCALSNIGFLYVGAQHRSPEVLCAGIASFMSHSIPKQWLLHVDKLSVLLVLSKVIREREILRKNPKLFFPIALAGCAQLLDLYLARKKGRSQGHIIWHLSAAYAANEFLKCVHT